MTGFSMSDFNSTCAEIFNTIREIKKSLASQDIQRGLVPWFNEFTGETTEEGLKNGLSRDTVVPHGDTHTSSTEHDVAGVFVDVAAHHGSMDAYPFDPICLESPEFEPKGVEFAEKETVVEMSAACNGMSFDVEETSDSILRPSKIRFDLKSDAVITTIVRALPGLRPTVSVNFSDHCYFFLNSNMSVAGKKGENCSDIHICAFKCLLSSCLQPACENVKTSLPVYLPTAWSLFTSEYGFFCFKKMKFKYFEPGEPPPLPLDITKYFITYKGTLTDVCDNINWCWELADFIIIWSFSIRSVHNDMKLWSFKVILGSNIKLMILVHYIGEEKQCAYKNITPTIDLIKMGELTEVYHCISVRNALDIVTAYFNGSRRQLTQNDGVIVGLNVVMINEPTTAVIVYGVNKKATSVGENNILILNLGDGCTCLKIIELISNSISGLVTEVVPSLPIPTVIVDEDGLALSLIDVLMRALQDREEWASSRVPVTFSALLFRDWSIMMGHENEFSVKAVSLMVLMKMKAIVKAYIGTTITNIVVIGFGYFIGSLYQAAKNVVVILQIFVIRFIIKHVFAVISYDRDKRHFKVGDKSHLILYFGGGYFDNSSRRVPSDCRDLHPLNCGGPIRSSNNALFEGDCVPLRLVNVTDSERWTVSTVGYFIDYTYALLLASWSSHVTNALDPKLFPIARISTGSTISFDASLENDTSILRLHLAELVLVGSTNFWPSFKMLRFDVCSQGNQVLHNIGIRKGVCELTNSVVKRDFPALITTNYIAIHFTRTRRGACYTHVQGNYGPLISATNAVRYFVPIVPNKVPSPKTLIFYFNLKRVKMNMVMIFFLAVKRSSDGACEHLTKEGLVVSLILELERVPIPELMNLDTLVKLLWEKIAIKTLPMIGRGIKIRAILNAVHGVPGFDGYHLEHGSPAQMDEHEAQIQFSLKHEVSTFLAVARIQQLTFPDNAFDLIHCAHGRVHQHGNEEKSLLELNRVMRPGFPFALEDEKYQYVLKTMGDLAKSMCGNIISKPGVLFMKVDGKLPNFAAVSASNNYKVGNMIEEAMVVCKGALTLAFSMRCTKKFFMFSLPRPPETVHLEDKVDFKGVGMIRAWK